MLTIGKACWSLVKPVGWPLGSRSSDLGSSSLFFQIYAFVSRAHSFLVHEWKPAAQHHRSETHCAQMVMLFVHHMQHTHIFDDDALDKVSIHNLVERATGWLHILILKRYANLVCRRSQTIFEIWGGRFWTRFEEASNGKTESTRPKLCQYERTNGGVSASSHMILKRLKPARFNYLFSRFFALFHFIFFVCLWRRRIDFFKLARFEAFWANINFLFFLLLFVRQGLTRNGSCHWFR